jgi:hypothetical protein
MLFIASIEGVEDKEVKDIRLPQAEVAVYFTCI